MFANSGLACAINTSLAWPMISAAFSMNATSSALLTARTSCITSVALANLTLRQRAANLLNRSPGHDSFGRAHHAREADDADALGADFFQTVDHGLAVRAARWTNVGYPFLRQAPPFDFVFAAHDRGDVGFEGHHATDFSLSAADLGDVPRVAAELVPVALWGSAMSASKLARFIAARSSDQRRSRSFKRMLG